MIERNARRLLWVIALALVLVQSLGAMHRLFHAGHGLHAQVASWKAVSPLSALWGEHDKASDCQSFDQASPDVLQSALVITQVMPLPAFVLALRLQERFALPERFFAARGPPVASI